MPRRTSAGTRGRLVMIQQKTEAKGPSGRPVETWSDLGCAWMEREDTASMNDEHFSMNKLVARADGRWCMLYQANMDPEAFNIPSERRLVYRDRIYDIVSATASGQAGIIELTTIANVAVTA